MLPRMEENKTALFTRLIVAFNQSFVLLGSTKYGILKPFATIWSEALVGRTREQIASAFFSFFIQDGDCHNIWSDNCTGQNKNWCLFSLLVLLINSHFIESRLIELNYSEPEHTFMSAVSFHHQDEQSIKKGANSMILRIFKPWYKMQTVN